MTAAQPAPGPRVAVLGPLVITGAAAELQPRQAELVVALALAGPAGLSAEVLRDRLGPDSDHPREPDSLRQLITRTRRRLGKAPGGGEYIVHGEHSRYALAPAVAVDWHEFGALARRGREDLDPAALRAAVALLRGQPLAGLYYWWLDPVQVEAMRAEIVDAAALLAELELEDGDAPAARRAARAGLAADTAAEQLWRLLMNAEDASGNTAGVHAAWRGCLAALADLAPGGEAHPDTLALYRELTTGRLRRPAPGTPGDGTGAGPLRTDHVRAPGARSWQSAS